MVRRRNWRVVQLLVATSMAAATTATAEGGPVAEMKLRDGSPAGQVEVLAAPGGAFIRVDVKGLPPGGHAIKFHETSKCEGDFSSAGAILNPLGAGQGLLNDQGPAAGDLPNIFVSSTGEAKAEFVTPMLQPGAEEGDVLVDEDGAAVVIYDKPDDHLGLAEGVGGERIACGVLAKRP